MIEKEKAYAPLIRYKGIMDFDGLYKFVKSWLESKGYFVQEQKYKDKGSEVEIKWVASKVVTEYFQYQIKVNFIVWGLSNVEIIDERTKATKKMSKGRIEVQLSGSVIEDYNDDWEKNWFYKKLHHLYRELKKNEREEIHTNNVQGDLVSLTNSVKGFLGM